MLKNRSLPLNIATVNHLEDKNSWMSIYQDDRKIGYAHKRLVRLESGYRVEESVLMRINTMGLVQEVRLNTKGRLNPDFTMSDFDFNINSGRFKYRVSGVVDGRKLSITTEGGDASRTFDYTLEKEPYLVTGILDVIRTGKIKPGQHWTFHIFDPGTLGQAPVSIEIIGPETIHVAGEQIAATKVLLTFKGTTQLAWLNENGDILQEEGLLGIRMVKTDRAEALSGITDSPDEDLTRLASVSINRKIPEPSALNELNVVIRGVTLDHLYIHGGRQSLTDRKLTIHKEQLADLPNKLVRDDMELLVKIFLDPSPFIQSDHTKIRELAYSIVDIENDSPLVKANKLIDWMQKNITKRPVLSVPDALTTLKNRVGDCNEHAVLMAALSRAAGIPARVEAGLVYLKGRFYYHAWNQLYLGRWITADALFGQLPADVTHIRFASGTHKQLDLMGLFGRVKLEIVDMR